MDGCGVAESLTQEAELVESLQAVDKDFVGLGAEGHPLAAGADLEVHDFVRVRDLSDGLGLITVPEEDWATGAGRHKLKLIVAPLAHRCVEAV